MLVIDKQTSTSCTLSYCFSSRRHLEDTKADLRRREGTVLRCIGDSEKLPKENRASALAVREWAMSRENIDAVVWTNLTSNFEKVCGAPFSVTAALAHLANLRPEHKARAAEYIWRAPDFVQTPLRNAVQTTPWLEAIHP